MSIEIVPKIQHFSFASQQCVQNLEMQWQKLQTLIRLLPMEQSDLGLHCLLRPICLNIFIFCGYQFNNELYQLHVLKNLLIEEHTLTIPFL